MLSTTQEVSDYRKNFHDYYYSTIKPVLSSFEEERKKQFSICSIIIGIAVVFAIVCIIYLLLHPDVWNTTLISSRTGRPAGSSGSRIVWGVICVFGCVCFFAYNRAGLFEEKVKTGVMNIFLKFFGDFTWDLGGNISQLKPIDESVEKSLENYGKFFKSAEIILTESNLFGGCVDWAAGLDYFTGTHRGVNIQISETILYRRNKHKDNLNIFSGVCIYLDLNKKCSKHTIVLEDNKLKEVFQSHKTFEKVELEDPEFNNMFDVYSQDQTEARYLLTPSFIERLKNVKKAYNAQYIRVSFRDNHLLLAIPCKKDMFKLGDVRKEITDPQEIQELFNQFAAVLSIVDLLKLDVKTGL